MNRAGRKPVRAGSSALTNRPSWNTGYNRVVTFYCDKKGCSKLHDLTSMFEKISLKDPYNCPSNSIKIMNCNLSFVCVGK